ncbi:MULTISPECIES: pyridoxal 5'-phosphate synthase [Microbacterium]|jgi:pyridoxamine 5'-phosphate oxidase|uniref:pyridoxine/pyridoxamine 5'-phosphate oxidase n=1 Tax=Microbacterium TaxID=33882 RepID=UPI0008D9FAAC|nr:MULTISPECIES: pyridoxamine 5'-phosphate oxidase family protein [Microbacterium]MAY50123.1 phenazine biosynthesis protein [Microbacterium sp.]HAM11866.1 phenazine biosynthesis protein [Microbacterium sp.]HAS33265.1 phenazine biosynthesis protein [Microbacterium sp.]HBR88511.1 phenazine biosynthesis protein [Microbacterium sp.]HBS74894.1 phenazine biosynthesis protein [Microbacterium sp.]|tara:strand:- start:6782 stop:7432 length:651 start_codon:yes stop_codon:yes gene_type:complete
MSRSTPDSHLVFPATPADGPRLDVATAPANPLVLLRAWWHAVAERGGLDPQYVTLATASADGIPSSRTVQLLAVEDDALLFTTNAGSRKGVEIEQTGRAAVSAFWRESAQSVNVTGSVVWADDAESDERFAAETRSVRASRSVSFHGLPLTDEHEQLERFTRLRDSGEPIERPAYWRWLRVLPDAMTFWEGHPEALNRRVHYRRADSRWTREAIQA